MKEEPTAAQDARIFHSRVLEIAVAVEKLLGRYQSYSDEEIFEEFRSRRFAVIIVDQADVDEVVRQIREVGIGQFLDEETIVRDLEVRKP